MPKTWTRLELRRRQLYQSPKRSPLLHSYIRVTARQIFHLNLFSVSIRAKTSQTSEQEFKATNTSSKSTGITTGSFAHSRKDLENYLAHLFLASPRFYERRKTEDQNRTWTTKETLQRQQPLPLVHLHMQTKAKKLLSYFWFPYKQKRQRREEDLNTEATTSNSTALPLVHLITPGLAWKIVNLLSVFLKTKNQGKEQDLNTEATISKPTPSL